MNSNQGDLFAEPATGGGACCGGGSARWRFTGNWIYLVLLSLCMVVPGLLYLSVNVELTERLGTRVRTTRWRFTGDSFLLFVLLLLMFVPGIVYFLWHREEVVTTSDGDEPAPSDVAGPRHDGGEEVEYPARAGSAEVDDAGWGRGGRGKGTTFCPFCGSPNRVQSNFCEFCGAQLRPSGDAA
ncbi:MAG: hypothetical protein Kow0069_06380 [Promethearchaeota archaeon]